MHFWNAPNGGLVSHVWWSKQKPNTIPVNTTNMCCFHKNMHGQVWPFVIKILITHNLTMKTDYGLYHSTSRYISQWPMQWGRAISTSHISDTTKPVVMKLETYNYHPQTTHYENAFPYDDMGDVRKYPVCNCQLASFFFLVFCYTHSWHQWIDFDDLCVLLRVCLFKDFVFPN